MIEWKYRIEGGNENMCIAEALRKIAEILNKGDKV